MVAAVVDRGVDGVVPVGVGTVAVTSTSETMVVLLCVLEIPNKRANTHGLRCFSAQHCDVGSICLRSGRRKGRNDLGLLMVKVVYFSA